MLFAAISEEKHHTCCSEFVMISGATLVLRSKFSASHFIEDCRKHKVTAIQYIGELCRYLCATPKVCTQSAKYMLVNYMAYSLAVVLVHTISLENTEGKLSLFNN